MASTQQSHRECILALMDLGTNSVRLSLVHLHQDGTYTVLARLREAVRLGEGEFAGHRIQHEAMERTILACSKLAQFARDNHADELIAVATSASREAENQAELLQRLHQQAGMDMRVISGSEEARLMYRGLVGDVSLGQDKALFVDVGGGSTEIVVGNQQRHDYLTSLPLGAIRLTNLYIPDREAAVSAHTFAKLKCHVREVMADSLEQLRKYTLTMLVGTSGTFEHLANVTAMHYFQRPWDTSDVLSYEQMHSVITMLCSLPLQHRRQVPGLGTERADIIIGGAAIIDTLLETLHISVVRVSKRGLRDGLLAEYIDHHVSTAEPPRL
ncbi:MAG TPA: hypothetical protein VHV83_04710 [Armatimonadota bacterium]|nr:hypothetical protein [Armatimonadota bacterium]